MGPTLTEATPCADHRAMTEAAPLPLARFTIVEANDADVPLCLRLATSLAAKIAAAERGDDDDDFEDDDEDEDDEETEEEEEDDEDEKPRGKRR